MLTPRIYHHREHGWIIETPIGLSPTELDRAIQFHKKVQLDKVRSMKSGDERDRAIRLLELLTTDSIRQSVRPAQDWMQDRIIY